MAMTGSGAGGGESVPGEFVARAAAATRSRARRSIAASISSSSLMGAGAALALVRTTTSSLSSLLVWGGGLGGFVERGTGAGYTVSA